MGDLPLTSGPTGAVVLNAAHANTPAYDAGLGEGDVIVSIGTAQVRGPADVSKAVDAARPGDRLDVRFVRAGKEHQAAIVLLADPAREVVTRESLGEKPTAEQLRMRAAWLGSRAK